jgi:hypothetical protein
MNQGWSVQDQDHFHSASVEAMMRIVALDDCLHGDPPTWPGVQL